MLGTEVVRCRGGGGVSVYAPCFDEVEGSTPSTSGGFLMAYGAQQLRATFPTANHRNNGGTGMAPAGAGGFARAGPLPAPPAGGALRRVKGGSISKARSGGLSRFFSKSKSFSSLKELSKGRYGLCASALEKSIHHGRRPLQRREGFGSDTRLFELDEGYGEEGRAGDGTREISPVPVLERAPDDGAGREYEIELEDDRDGEGAAAVGAGREASPPNAEGDLLVPDAPMAGASPPGAGGGALDGIETLSMSFERLGGTGR